MDHEHDPPRPSLAPDDGPSLFGADPAPPSAYRVLARKYRPTTFADLIGQEPMVRTLENAFDLNRIHQAYLLTGVRGVGKTTTARILARAFNYELPAKTGGPRSTSRRSIWTSSACIVRRSSTRAMSTCSRWTPPRTPASTTSARSSTTPATARSWRAPRSTSSTKCTCSPRPPSTVCLKTLEEPPEHVKFIFATTEIDKVPVTVRSRCQRFDLRRIDAGLLAEHLREICEAEGVAIEPDALAMIARAAEGSARDALSLLDQAIAYGAAHSAAARSPPRICG